MCRELCSNLHRRIYQCLLWVSESLHCHRYAKPDKFYIFSEDWAGQIMTWKTFWWSDSDLYLSTFFKQRRDFFIDRSTFASRFDSSTLLLHQRWKGSTWTKLKLNSNQKHTKSSLSHNNSTCYFSSSVLRGRCWSWWPRVKIGLKWMCLIALNNPDNTCWLGSILIGKIFLKIIESFRNEKLYHTRTWMIYLCCLNGTFPLLELSMTAYPSENLGTTVQNIAFIIFQDGFCKFTIQLIDLTISNAAKEDIIRL